MEIIWSRNIMKYNPHYNTKQKSNLKKKKGNNAIKISTAT